MSVTGKIPAVGIFLIVLQVLLGIGAVGGGAALVIDPSGELIGMPNRILAHSPFSSFFIPAIILFIILGIGPLTAAHGLARRSDWSIMNRLNLFPDQHWAWAYSLYTGFALIIWIALEVYFIQAVTGVHLFYLFYGLMIQAVTMLPAVQKYYSE